MRLSSNFLLSLLTGVLLVEALAAAPARLGPPSDGATAADKQKVLVLGDSLAVSPNARESFPSELQKKIDKADLEWTVVNAGVRGDTTAEGLARAPRLLEGIDVMVLALGANDGLRGVPIATIERNLSRIIEMAQRRDIDVLLCGMETIPRRDLEYLLGFHSLFPRLQQTYNVSLVPFLLDGVALVPNMNGPDRVHPNAAGARRIADVVWPYLERMLKARAEKVI